MQQTEVYRGYYIGKSRVFGIIFALQQFLEFIAGDELHHVKAANSSGGAVGMRP